MHHPLSLQSQLPCHVSKSLGLWHQLYTLTSLTLNPHMRQYPRKAVPPTRCCMLASQPKGSKQLPNSKCVHALVLLTQFGGKSCVRSMLCRQACMDCSDKTSALYLKPSTAKPSKFAAITMKTKSPELLGGSGGLKNFTLNPSSNLRSLNYPHHGATF